MMISLCHNQVLVSSFATGFQNNWVLNPYLLASCWREQQRISCHATVLNPKEDFWIRSLQAERAVCFFEKLKTLHCAESILLKKTLSIRSSGSFCRFIHQIKERQISLASHHFKNWKKKQKPYTLLNSSIREYTWSPGKIIQVLFSWWWPLWFLIHPKTTSVVEHNTF